MKSIFDLVEENLDEKEFVLKKEFYLPDEKPEEKIKYAPGAMDGIIYYHIGISDDSASDELMLLKKAVEYASDEKYAEAMESVDKFAIDYSAFTYIDVLQNYVVENQSKLQGRNIYMFAIMLITKATRKEAVKVGMILLELFNTQENEDVKNLIKMMGLSDEFSLYSGFLMQHWDDSAEELFAMAQKVCGWGRIHAIRMMKDVTPEMVHWLMLHGIDNDVIPAYSALDVYGKIDFANRIVDNNLSLEEYRSLASILDALLDEEPVPGISTIEDRYDMIDSFIEMTISRHDIEAEDLNVLFNVTIFLEDEHSEQSEELMADLVLFLTSDRVRNMVKEAVKDGRCLRLAKNMNIE